MKKVAAFFGKEVLLGLTVDDIFENIVKVREQVGDRGVLRALHFIRENERVQKEVTKYLIHNFLILDNNIVFYKRLNSSCKSTTVNSAHSIISKKILTNCKGK